MLKKRQRRSRYTAARRLSFIENSNPPKVQNYEFASRNEIALPTV